MSELQKNIYQSLVDYFGGQESTAKALKVSQPLVSGWVRQNRKMSELVAIRAERATGGKFKSEDLCLSLREFQSQVDEAQPCRT
ncbi:transcriptional regulator [Acinetobacter higginsii]|uniref:transcriptional regulator n=1 Tax=Acinetobacter higginsii TaxID=70347 RepID=UPI001F4ADB45|nr:Cro/CI family transcriptional regulator [Acinetobacter higginsii]MCH7381300.1 helix-turn-helix domain-containing protein [Acinetobacter higginsii]